MLRAVLPFLVLTIFLWGGGYGCLMTMGATEGLTEGATDGVTEGARGLSWVVVERRRRHTIRFFTELQHDPVIAPELNGLVFH